LCREAWPEVPPPENPMGFVTNGVHVPTFMRQPWTDLLEQALGPAWRQHLTDRSLISKIADIPDERFWFAKQEVKRQMLQVVRDRLVRQHTRNQLSEAHIHRLLRYVDPQDANVLTIGFARRFATYKRATLLFSSLEWLASLVDNAERPVIFLFSGKAHPADEPAQHMIREIYRVSNQPPFVGKILLVENYDIGLGRMLTSGVDVWLNTPVHPLEASGTSGMKAAINGTVNLSVLDGWWAEGYDGSNGWGIPPSVGEDDAAVRDRHDAETLYEILQDDVVPLYYARDEGLGYSPRWVHVCKRSMVSVLPHFNSQRVLHDYACRFYGPGAAQGKRFAQDNFAVARDLAAWKQRVRAAWNLVRVERVASGPTQAYFDDEVQLEVDVVLNGLVPADVRVECVLRRERGSEITVPVKAYAERVQAADGLAYVDGEPVMISAFEPLADVTSAERCRYRLRFKPPWSGALSYRIRAVPQHPHLAHPYEVGLMRWL
jgi:starch phosphorylase